MLRHDPALEAHRSGRSGRWIAAAFAIWSLYVIWLAQRIDLQYWDGYEYLQNARILVGSRGASLTAHFNSIRPPLLPILLTPLMAFYQPSSWVADAAPHLLAAVLSILAVAAALTLLARNEEGDTALIAALLLLLNPLILHYSTFVMTDLLSMLFATGFVFAYLRARHSGSWTWFGVAGVALALAFTTKYSMLLMVAVLLAAEALLWARGRSAGDHHAPPYAKIAFSIALAAGSSALLLAGYLKRGGLPDIGWSGLVAQLAAARSAVAEPSATDLPLEYLSGLWSIYWAPALLAALVGSFVALRRGKLYDTMLVAWLAVFLLGLSTGIRHKEARYLIPALPAFVAMAGRGFAAAENWAISAIRGGRISAPGRSIKTALFAVAVLPVSLGALAEIRRLADPIYHSSIVERVTASIRSASGEGAKVVLATDFILTLFPRDARSVPGDEYLHFHHVGIDALRYQSGLALLTASDIATQGTAPEGALLPANCFGPQPEACDQAFIQLFRSRGFYLWSNAYVDGATNLPAESIPSPILAARIERRTFALEAARASGRAPWREDTTSALASAAPRADLSALLDQGWRLYCASREEDALSRIVSLASGDRCEGSLEGIRIEEQVIRFPT